MKSSNCKIGLLSFDYDPPRGGLGRAMQTMANVLREKGGEVIVRWSPWRVVFLVNRWIRCNRIHTLLMPVGPGGVFLWRKPKGVRIIVVCYHTYWQQCRMVPGDWWKRVIVPLERRTLRMTDRVLCYCEDTRRVLEEEYGLRNVKVMRQILDIPGVKNDKRKAKSDICLYIGRKDRRKGFDLLMQAWQEVKNQIPHAELTCITQGNLSNRELCDHVERADIILVPSYLEGFGLVAAESMMMGKAVLACNSDGLKSLIRHDDTGWLVSSGNVHALEEAWVRLLKDHVLRERLGSSAKEFMRQRFDRRTATQEFMIECGTA